MSQCEVSFEELSQNYDSMIKKQITSLGIYKDYDRYYQCGLLGLWQAQQTYQPDKGKFSTYAIVNVRGKMMDELKRELSYLERHNFPDETYFGQIVDESQVPILEEDMLEPYIDKLNKGEQTWVRHAIIEQKKVGEIASDLGMPIETVKNWRKQALRKLREGQVRGLCFK
ncbi:sigma-70 family RNA polymerase sigma factor [Tuberibacillus sp. Marseille-P3662]|uniref:sigma-70 family RNA polymerase sigma factor n=1 Tax=Tuberibacillus sp. Marseille-P3662 TaxID=1965358 RepID=UPI001592F4F4|nr:sigma-70 family RNA polymerase sigma factor [Tuberibacillus sp. Marseille-P3662]